MEVYKGFIPSNSDGKALLKEEYVTKKKLPEEKVEIVQKEINTEDSHKNGQKGEGNGKKNKKARGQNKNRPRSERESKLNMLCPSKVNSSNTCMFGEKCQYLHDISEYMKIKAEDLGSECYSYRTYGSCRYTYTCRFGKDHITQTPETGYKNIENDELLEKVGIPLSKNILTKEIRTSLRKRTFDFSKSIEIMKSIEDIQSKRKKLYEEHGNGKSIKNELYCKEVTDLSSNNSDFNVEVILLRNCEKKTIDFKGKLYLAPLTTCGNLPFRVVCKGLGADITCGEMALSTNLLQANTSEWALLKRHHSEDIFGVQLCGGHPDTMSRCAELLNRSCDVDFIDINMGCPIDLIYKKGAGSALMKKANKLFDIVTSMNNVLDIPLTCKLRAGIVTNKNSAHSLLPMLRNCGVALTTVHGRSREARYTKIADWNYIDQCGKVADPMPLFGNGDVFSYQDYYSVMENTSISGVMMARGALIKPWLFTEIKERRDWDISSTERFDILKKFVNLGLVHWGSDTRGIETTRRFLLEWLSFLHRYIPVGILEQVPQRINDRPPYYVGRNDLETLLASANSSDWVTISERLLGKVPDSFQFLPKHKANSYK